MKEVTLTELRRNFFQLVDEALATGEPIVFKRKGERVIIKPDRPPSREEAVEAWLEARWRHKFGGDLEEIEESAEARWQPAETP